MKKVIEKIKNVFGNISKKQYGTIGTALGSILIVVGLLTMVSSQASGTYAASTTGTCTRDVTKTVTSYSDSKLAGYDCVWDEDEDDGNGGYICTKEITTTEEYTCSIAVCSAGNLSRSACSSDDTYITSGVDDKGSFWCCRASGATSASSDTTTSSDTTCPDGYTSDVDALDGLAESKCGTGKYELVQNGSYSGCYTYSCKTSSSSSGDTEETITLTFKNGSSIVASKSCTKAAGATSCSSDIIAPGATTKEGYTFNGWGGYDGCTTGSYTANASFRPTKSATYYACYIEGTSDDDDKDDDWSKDKCSYFGPFTVTRDQNYLNCKYYNIEYNNSATEDTTGNIQACCSSIGYIWVGSNFTSSGGGYEYCVLCSGSDDNDDDTPSPSGGTTPASSGATSESSSSTSESSSSTPKSSSSTSTNTSSSSSEPSNPKTLAKTPLVIVIIGSISLAVGMVVYQKNKKIGSI